MVAGPVGVDAGRVELGEGSGSRGEIGDVGSGPVGKASIDANPVGLSAVPAGWVGDSADEAAVGSVVRVGLGDAGNDRFGVRVGALVTSGGSRERVGPGSSRVRVGVGKSAVREPVGSETVGRISVTDGRAGVSGIPSPQEDSRTDVTRTQVSFSTKRRGAAMQTRVRPGPEPALPPLPGSVGIGHGARQDGGQQTADSDPNREID